MKLQIFQSHKGDCLLLEGAEGGRVLCDGGMASSMKKYARTVLSKLRDDGEKLDYVYVSHIDQDHISGVLQLLEDEFEWRLYDYHRDNGSPIRKPDFPRPPEIGGIWHNAFRDQVGKNAGDVEDLLAAAAPSLLATSVPELVELGEELQGIAVSIPEAIKVSRYASPELLDIPVNKLPGSHDQPKLLMYRNDQKPFQVGSMRFTIVGPTREELTLLKEGWNNFLRDAKNDQKLKDLRAEIKRKVEVFGQEAFDLRDWNGIEDFKGVTTPNIASLMFMVEEAGKRILLTGDSQQDIILKGLKLAGFLGDGYCHVDVLKVQHHASEHNVDENFCRLVSADHYVFCGNGSDGNPERSVIQQIYDSRLGPAKTRSLAPESDGRPFKFWFSTTSKAQIDESQQQQTYAAVEALVASLEQQSNGLLSFVFNDGPRLELSV
ncbi:MBL fold metallo-hydrolase [Rhizobium leguminosarum]|uniref:MBL fold metallo-hydrolase n=1 Tax=Rhizobium leguminosarum TaxID=384 RepID=UPI00143FAA2B|nr:MBL fold metallo-hydrolase [Rhizobium leguminosarum]NKL19300.1 MBL fold metallo-hydrolase [Rhizobium leguminosarum bv. viciae]NKL57728.1 MBL fold metallo-hydrolase [Rhizobium leguminosarum bv. viciae]